MPAKNNLADKTSDRPAVELLRVFFAHDVETPRDRRVDADREIVVDDVARYRVAFFVPVLVPNMTWHVKGKGSPYSITERRVREPIPVLGSQPAGDVSHKPGGRLLLLAARPAVTPATLKRAATNFAAW